MLKGIPVSRMMRKVTRMAKSDGTMAFSRAGPDLKTRMKVTKMIEKVMAKLSTRVGTRLPAMVAWRTPLPAS